MSKRVARARARARLMARPRRAAQKDPAQTHLPFLDMGVSRRRLEGSGHVRC